MGIEEEYDKLMEAMRGAERSIQQTMEMDWVSGQGMRDFLKGMLHQCRYDLVLLDIWRDRIVGEEK